MFSHDNYIDILKEEFGRRLSTNSRYSLRAFAKNLDIPVASLSDTLNKKQGISLKTAQKIATNLWNNKQEQDYFCNLVIAKGSKSKTKRELANKEIEQIVNKYKNKTYNTLQLDAMKVISDWYHLAILELTYLENFQSESKWIASKLGISDFEAKEAIKRLVKIGLLKNKKGNLVDTNSHLATPSGIPSKSIKDFHKQIMNKALMAVETQSVEQREFSTSIMAVNKSDLPKVGNLINKLRSKFSNEMGKSEKKNKVYALSIQFIDLTNSGSE